MGTGTGIGTGAGAGRLIDYKEMAQAKRGLLQPLATSFFEKDGRASGRYREFIALYPDAEGYARKLAALPLLGQT